MGAGKVGRRNIRWMGHKVNKFVHLQFNHQAHPITIQSYEATYIHLKLSCL